MQWALNHMTTPNLGYEDFLDLAKSLTCIGVEVRNDIDRPLFDGMEPAAAGALARSMGLRLVGLSQVYPFNSWSDQVARQVGDLITTAKAAGAETILQGDPERHPRPRRQGCRQSGGRGRGPERRPKGRPGR
jgi:2-keto-myo-inositol isomerase